MDDLNLSVPNAEQFEAVLSTLLRVAHENGIEVEGGWDVDGADGHPDWDVVVTVVERDD